VGAGLGLGLALLARSTWIILFPLWVAGWLASFLWSPLRDQALCNRLRWGIVGVFAMALYVVNLGYVFEGSFRPLGDFTFASKALTGLPDSNHGNRFAGTWLGTIPVPIPADYLLGMDTQRCDFEEPGWSYL